MNRTGKLVRSITLSSLHIYGSLSSTFTLVKFWDIGKICP